MSLRKIGCVATVVVVVVMIGGVIVYSLFSMAMVYFVGIALRESEAGLGYRDLSLGNPQYRPVWTPDGTQVMFVYDGRIYLVEADGSGIRVISEDVESDERFRSDIDYSPDISPDGTRVVYTTYRYETEGVRNFEIATSVLSGADHWRLTRNTHPDTDPVWSPDGTRIAFRGEGGGLLTMAPDGSDVRRIIHLVRGSTSPTWSPTGRHIASLSLSHELDSRSGLYRMAVYSASSDGSSLMDLGPTVSPPTWSPDGQRIAFVSYDDDRGYLYTVRPDGSDPQRVVELFTRDERMPTGVNTLSWSPDGSKIMVLGDWIHLIDLDNPKTPQLRQSSIGFRKRGAWSPDGSRIAVYDHTPVPDALLFTVDSEGAAYRVLVRVTDEGLVAGVGEAN